MVNYKGELFYSKPINVVEQNVSPGLRTTAEKEDSLGESE